MKKTIVALLAAVIVLALGIGAFANGGYTMGYLPGTQDEVTNMPDDGSGIGAETYTVSENVPTREGYEFMGWILDYGLIDKYRVTYSVAGDPVYGMPADATVPATVYDIWAGTDVTLAAPLTTSWETADGSPVATTTHVLISYRGMHNGEITDLCPQVVDEKPVGYQYLARAVVIEDYRPNGPTEKTLELLPETVGTWTFSGWFSDEACTTPVTEITAISADTTVYGSWEYSEVENVNEIVFEYDPLFTLTYELVDGCDPFSYGVPETVSGIIGGSNVTLADPLEAPPVTQPEPGEESYTVKYLEVGTDEPVKEDIVVTGLDVGDIVEECAVDIEGYTIAGASRQSLEIKQRYQILITPSEFRGWYSDEDCTDLITEIKGISADTTVYGKWTPGSEEVIELAKNEIVFYYEPYVAPQTVSYTVQYFNTSFEKIAEDKDVPDVEPGTYIIECAPDIDNYTPLYPTIEFVAEPGEHPVLIFIYEYSVDIIN